MPTKYAYDKAVELIQEIGSLGLNGWKTEMTITDEKKGISINGKLSLRINSTKTKPQKEEGDLKDD